MKRLTATLFLALSTLPALAQEANINLLSDGAVQISASTQSANFPARAMFDGDRTGYGWEQGGGWQDTTPGVFGDWIQGLFGERKSVSRVVLYTLQNNYPAPTEPTDADVCTFYGIRDFQVQTTVDDGATWTTAATVTGNALCKRTVIFPATRTDGVRVVVNGSWDGNRARGIELEAYSR